MASLHEPAFRILRYHLTAAALLILMALLAGGAALRESVAIDEVAHIGAGVSCLQKFDLRLNFEHPPLAKVLAALPLVLRGVRADYSHLSWSFSLAQNGFGSMLGEWVFGHWLLTRWNDPQTTLAWARAPMLLLTLTLGFLVYLYASRLTDPRGGLLCLALFVSTPAFLAFGPLVLTDIPVTLFSLVTLWMFAEMWRSGSRGSVVRFGCALAAALLSKFSAGLLLVACAAFAVSLRWHPLPGAESRAFRRQGWRNTGKGIALAALLVYTAYFILSWNQPTSGLDMLGQLPLWLRRLLMPGFLYGLGLAAFGVMASRATFILGHAYTHGVWFYFPVLLLLKSTLAFLLLLLLGLAAPVAFRRRLPQPSIISGGRELHWRALWVFFLVFVFACLASQLDLSIRHFSIPLVLLILLLAPLPRLLESRRLARWIPPTLAAISLFTAVRAYPFYLPFLNSLALGHPGYELVNDSNLDWNQSLPEVHRFAQRHGIQTVLIDAYSFSDPVIYVPQGRFWNCQDPSAGDSGQWAVVSANMIAESHNCLWLLRYPHQPLAGGSMYAFQLPAAIPPAGAPGGPPLRSDWHNLAGTPASWPDLRLIYLVPIHDPRELPETWNQMMHLGLPNP